MKWFEKISGAEAEMIAGQKLDKRKTYYKKTEEGLATNNSWAFPGHNGVFILDRFTMPCSGCSCDCDSEYGVCSHGASGCRECGYTGRRRDSMHTPIHLEEIVKDQPNAAE